MLVIKRNGQEVTFEKEKIVNAIKKANAEVDNVHQLSDYQILAIADSIEKQAEDMNHALGVEEIQDMVETGIMDMRGYEVAQKYVRYRYRREISRKSNTTDDAILSLLDQNNELVKQENANKDPIINSTQRDYMAGEVSKDLTRRVLLPEDVVKAHDEGLIHFHDADYFAQREHNCFHSKTKFYTSEGIKSFKDCSDGQEIEVMDKNGRFRKATVHKYGKQPMNKVTFTTAARSKSVICTSNHRWLLNDGSVTTDLKVGDTLLGINNEQKDNVPKTYREKKFFSLGFLVGDGCDHKGHRKFHQVRLCGDKTKYKDVFASVGYVIHPIKDSDDLLATATGLLKQKFLNSYAWNYLDEEDRKWLFLGLYSADGATKSNKISTVDDRVIDLIRNTSFTAGFYISSETLEKRDTEYKKNSELHSFHFSVNQPDNLCWKVNDIQAYHSGALYDAWCIEEPETHSFILDGGMITGNCDLINLEDMLQNGTVISGTKIEKPHSFFTACNVTTQIVAQVASNQYGGQSFSLAHLVPFVDISRQKIRNQVIEERKACDDPLEDDAINKTTEIRLKEEIKSGIQTIQYQLITLMTCNGQAPFVTMFMYLDEVSEGQSRDDMAMLIEEVLNQRIQGVKNEQGVWITPAFPKLIYVLDEDNITKDSKYWYLTELAAKCTAKRMVPDYISAKKMKELKKGEVYTCMGCVDGDEVITYTLFGAKYTESFRRMWDRCSDYASVQLQPNGQDLYIDVKDVTVWDQKNGFTPVKRLIKNRSNDWYNVRLSNGRTIRCTSDHPFETENRGVVHAKDLTRDDVIAIDQYGPETNGGRSYNTDRAWLLGFLLCNSSYYDHRITIPINLIQDKKLADSIQEIFEFEYGLKTTTTAHYKGICVLSDHDGSLTNFRAKLISMFNGKAKSDRHIPNEVFEWNDEARASFLAGMIDAEGFIDYNNVVLTSTNKELAIQEVLLAQSLGMIATIEEMHYVKPNKTLGNKYQVKFIPTKELFNYLHGNVSKTYSGALNQGNNYMTANPIAVEHLGGYADYSYDLTTESEHFTVSGIYSHNCRSFLTVEDSQRNPDGSRKFYGRFNQGVCTINLVDVACSSDGNFDKFWETLDERLELCHKALRCRHERLLGTPSDVAPILWQNGALARLQPGETIDKLLYDGYSTISLGYAGLCEMCVRMFGKTHTDPEAKEFALQVMQRLNDKCAEWRAAENIAYSVYGTPLESTTYKFAKCLQDRWGVIPGVTDKNYVTNSYHVHVTEEINAFDKLAFESEFQELSPGGAISYVEVPDMQNNIPAVLSVMQFIYDNIMYAELNTKSDYCEVCGFDGEIQIVEDEDGKLVWECPNCGNRDQKKMSVARRTCGYIGTQFWNQGRTQEIKDRVLHL